MREWEKHIRRVEPYVPGEQPKDRGIIKLNTNENPYPPAPGVLEALKRLEGEGLRKYPDPAAADLTEALAENYGVGTDQVFVGVGSDDVLAMCFLTFFNSKKPILFPDITYSFYDVWAGLFQIPFERIPLDDQFKIRPEDYKKENGGVIFPNPNAPTGLLLPLDQVEEILEANRDVIVIVDEAYIDFGGVSALSLIDRYDNLLVVQTFSKSRSLAGMRIGFAMGNPQLIRCLQDVKYSFNSYTMNQAAIAAGTAALADRDYFERTRKKIMDTREKARRELRKLGFVCRDSAANFLFVTHPDCPGEELFLALRQAGIYVRYFNKPRIDQYLRITIGTDEEMEALTAFLKKYLEERGGTPHGNV
ncbi:MAG TPA: histidinol-phosphate transaminase [Candidatus Merdiplasma excrementigallinarum]|uniref:Histidinol-phosphate aminotransferase n=1 Tax=Candidatus Merdiplasma excrementigallinarum TaxID=2840864 RepID=A0A9D1T911_9FIRM|nr:histidinol-phosphate transaminase [Candidatus Merdiplasma excrementigallinarum]